MKFRHVVLLMTLIFNICKKGRPAGVRECYQCRSDLDQRCDEIKTDVFLKVCEKNTTSYDVNIDSNVCQKVSEFSCRKTMQILYFLGEVKTIVLRECTVYQRIKGGERMVDCTYARSYASYASVICDCETDGCNSSPRTRILSWLITFSIFLSIFFHLKLSIVPV